MWTLSWKTDHSHKEILPVTTACIAPQVEYTQSHAPLHLCFTAYTVTGGKGSHKEVSSDGGVGDEHWRERVVLKKSNWDLQVFFVFQINLYVNKYLKTKAHPVLKYCIASFDEKPTGKHLDFILRLACEYLLSGIKITQK